MKVKAHKDKTVYYEPVCPECKGVDLSIRSYDTVFFEHFLGPNNQRRGGMNTTLTPLFGFDIAECKDCYYEFRVDTGMKKLSPDYYVDGGMW